MVGRALKKRSDSQRWFESDQEKSRRQHELQKTGIGLEVMVRRRLRELGYPVKRTSYEMAHGRQGKAKPRELDFLGQKDIQICKLPSNSQLRFSLLLLGECEQSQTRDLFLFEMEQEETLDNLDFPVRFYHEPIPPQNVTIGSLRRYYHFPLYTERILEVDSKHHGRRYSDRIIHKSCEGLLAATKYFRDKTIEIHEAEVDAVFRSVQGLYDSAQEQKRRSSSDASAWRILAEESPATIWRAATLPPLVFQVPLLVADDQRSLVRTVVNSSGKILLREEAETAIYFHVSEKAESFRDFLGETQVFAVVLCKRDSLAQTVEIVENGTRQMIKEYQIEVDKDPSIILEGMFSGVGFRSFRASLL